jgi:flagellin-like protein
MRKLLKSKKALSPVVAAIILIAVTVAVSIAVAAWMGSLTFTFMETEQVSISKVEFGTAATQINATLMNTGTTDVVVNAVTVTGSGVTGSSISSTTIPKGSTVVVPITVTGGWTAGTAYNVEIVSTKGNKFSYTETA